MKKKKKKREMPNHEQKMDNKAQKRWGVKGYNSIHGHAVDICLKDKAYLISSRFPEAK